MYCISLTPQEEKEERGVWWPCVQQVVLVPENRVWPIRFEILNLLLSNAILVAHARMASHAIFAVVRDIFLQLLHSTRTTCCTHGHQIPLSPFPFSSWGVWHARLVLYYFLLSHLINLLQDLLGILNKQTSIATCTCILHECSTSIHTVGTVALSTRCGFSPSWAAATAVALEWLDWMPPHVMILSQPLRRASAIRNSSFRIWLKDKVNNIFAVVASVYFNNRSISFNLLALYGI